jgi:signal transduction histidine kinase
MWTMVKEIPWEAAPIGRFEETERTMADALSAHIAVLDDQGVILEANLAWRQFAAFNGMNDPDAGIGQNYLAICDAAAGEGAQEAREAAAGIRGVLAGRREEFYLEYPCSSPHQERWFALRVIPFVGEGGLRRLIASHEEITARKQAESLEGERVTLRNAVNEMERMLGVVAHELRTPLAGMRITSEFLLDEKAHGTGDWRPLLAGLHEEAVRMGDTVDNLLEAARLNSGQARWNWGRFALGEVCRDAMESVRPLIDESKVRLTWSAAPADLEMGGDAGAVRRLILNLLSNARKHTADGGIHLSAQQEQGEDGRRVRLVVRDSGAGISPEIINRLGKAFALNSGAVGSEALGGTGLGLGICKGIAAAHGGYLRIESPAGQGTAISAILRADLPGPAAVSLPDNLSFFTSLQLETL